MKKTFEMKKIFALMVFGLFLISMMPLTLAENDTTTSTTNSAANAALRDQIKANRQDAVQKRNDLINKRTEAMEKRAEVVSTRADLVAERLERRQKAIDIYNERRQLLMQEKEKFQNARDRWNELKSNAANLRGTLSEDTLAAAKDMLMSANEAMVAHLEELKAKVEADSVLSDERKAEITTAIDAEIETLTALQSKISAAANRADLAAVAKEMKDIAKDLRAKAKKFFARFISAKLDRLLEKADALEDRIENAIEKLKENGYDTSNLEANLAIYEENVDIAEEKHELAKAAVSGDEKDVEQAKAYMKETEEALRTAHGALKEIVREIAQIPKTYGVNPSEVVSTSTDAASDDGMEDANDAEDTDDAEDTEGSSETGSDDVEGEESENDSSSDDDSMEDSTDNEGASDDEGTA